VIKVVSGRDSVAKLVCQNDEFASSLENTTAMAYASRSMSDTEMRYAQIEEEALAITWACEQFSNYLIGTKFKLETDNKPLVPLLSTKDLAELLARIQHFKKYVL
jgi:hypothetical protein